MSEPAIFEICFPAHITRAPVCRPGETIAGVVVLKLSSPLMASHMLLKFCGMERVRRTPVSQRSEAVSAKKQQQQQQKQQQLQQQTSMSQTMVMDKEFFRREIILWGEPKVSSLRSVPSGTVHRFHFSFTMPYVNMPTPRQTADVEISYSLMASLFTEVVDPQRGERSLHDFHKTTSKCFHFEPVIQQRISHGVAAAGPLESIVALKDVPVVSGSAAAPAPGTSSSEAKLASALASASLMTSQSTAGKTHMNLHVFHPTPAYLPGELVELLILAPAGKKIVNAAFQLRENVRCRKSSAPIIDESDVPLLWKYSVDLTPPQEITFSKLSKANVTQDIGMLGRYMFTGHNVFSVGNNDNGMGRNAASMDNASLLQHKALPPLPSVALSPPPQTSSPRSTSDTSTATSVVSVYRSLSGKSGSRKLLGRGDSGLGITTLPEETSSDGQSQQQSRVSMPLSPLAESQELMRSANSSSQTLDTSGSALTTDGSHPPLTTVSAVRSRTGSLGVLHQPSSSTPQLFQQSYVPTSLSILSPPLSRPRQPSIPAITMSGQTLGNPGSRLSQSMSTTGETILDDSRSDRSSISDSISSRYHQPSSFGSKLLSGNFPSLNRGVSSYNAAMAAAAVTASLPKYNRLSVTPVPLGSLMAKGSYRFAKIQFTLPPITDMSPVSSVFLDFDYTVDIAMTLGGNFGTTKKAAGKLPLKIVTIRTAAKVGAPTEGTLRESAVLSEPVVVSSAVAVSATTVAVSTERRGSGSEESTDSLHDSLSCLNLSITSSDDNANIAGISAVNRNGSPVNTLSELHFDSKLPGVAADGNILSTDADKLSLDGSYPCLRSFVQNGEKVPMPELEIIKIGTATI
ncbi:hypothetical protein GGI19_002906 [Coemansia pectinata]|uniref:Arrestin-like N-terminal domain-containing protein n=1 Tax=Coemansia pectinata TaxID=1052879 RepID=A0A9W8GV27_9FUNG|nr:hypothetical protein GGI19_002906 [Coemansia pectinata]